MDAESVPLFIGLFGYVHDLKLRECRFDKLSTYWMLLFMDFLKTQLKILIGIHWQLSIPPLCDRVESFAFLSKKKPEEIEKLHRFGDQWCLDPYKHELGHAEALKVLQSGQWKLLTDIETAPAPQMSNRLPLYNMTKLSLLRSWK